MIHIDDDVAFDMGATTLFKSGHSISLAANPFAPNTDLCKSWYDGWLHMADSMWYFGTFDFGLVH